MSEQVTAHPETITVADLWKQWAYWKLLIDADVCAIGELDSITRLAPRGTSDFLFYANEDTLLKSHYELEIVWYKPSYSDLLAELDTLRTQNRELREALNFYANADNWRNELVGRTMKPSVIERDNGETARKALEGAK